jgi:hypothetical protein
MTNNQHVTNVELKWFCVGFFPGLNVLATDVKIPLILQGFRHSVTRDKNAVCRAQCCNNHSEKCNFAVGWAYSIFTYPPFMSRQAVHYVLFNSNVHNEVLISP